MFDLFSKIYPLIETFLINKQVERQQSYNWINFDYFTEESGKEDVKYVKKDSDSNGFINESADNEAKPLECRAINYLVNQYLLTNHYKLSSITFCEENSSQVIMG